MTIPAATMTRLEKAAVDNGFDIELPRSGDWLAYASTHAPLRIWLTAFGDNLFLAAFSQQNVARALRDAGISQGTAFTNPLPPGASGARGVTDIPTLHRLVRRAFQLSKTLPDELLHAFERKTAAMPKTTEAERLVLQRVGQDIFRDGLLDYWEGRCAVTGLAVPELLRASHIKAWAACENDAERLDVWNGLLLAPHLDAAFDRGFITIADGGEVVVSPALTDAARRILALDAPLCIRALADGHRGYLRWHRERLFKAAPT
ncbi:MAG: HNH endonuclease [Polyangiaceae bacterium]|nr:HNH endonuclease [Polyangiaceae bacterium]